MLYIKKLSLVAALTVASIVWLPLLASRGMLATLNWCGRGLMAGLRSKDSGVKLVSALGLAFFGLPWLAAIGVILALASYEVAVFRLMQSLFKIEDIGFRPGDKPKGPTPEPTGAPPVQPRLPKVIQFPTSSAQLSAPQALVAARRYGWDPVEMGYSWSSQYQCWHNHEEALAPDGERIGRFENGVIRAA